MKFRKKGGLLTILIFSGIMLAACSNTSLPEAPAEIPAEEATPRAGEILSLVKDFEQDTGMLVFDEVEWISMEDTERIAELGLDADGDFPNPYYVYNESEIMERLPLAADVEVWLVNWDDLADPLQTDLEGLAERLDTYEALYTITIEGFEIVKVYEVYTP